MTSAGERLQQTFHDIGPYSIIERDRIPTAADRERANGVVRKFAEMRGRMIGHAIAVEHALAETIANWFCPLEQGDSEKIMITLAGTSVALNRQFIHVVLLAEACTFAVKARILKQLIRDAALPDFEGEKKDAGNTVEVTLKAVMEVRNQFAHRLVGISITSFQVHAWNQNSREWEEVNAACEESFVATCTRALGLLNDVASQFSQIHREGKFGTVSF